jgi:hypothetical protein
MTMAKNSQADRTDFAWPPPEAELDALEPLFIGNGAEGATPPPATAEQPPAAGRRSALRVALMLSPYVAAIAVGAMLGEHQARLSKLPVPPTSPSFVVHERVARAAEPPSVTPARTPRPTPPAASPPVASVRPRPDTAASAPAPTAAAGDPAPREQSPTASSEETPPGTALAAPGLTDPVLAAAGLAAAGGPAEGLAATAPAATMPLPGPEPATPEAASVLDAATPMAPPVAAPAARVVSSAIANDQAAIRHTLKRYEEAYENLDASAAAAVWPSIDVSALTHAFAGLKTQRLQFDRCDLDVGYQSATAVCSGSTHIVRRIGKPEPLIEPLHWTFHLKRTDSADWKIESVATAR